MEQALLRELSTLRLRYWRGRLASELVLLLEAAQESISQKGHRHDATGISEIQSRSAQPI
ncbi:hypothetical protein C5E11_14825 [Clavibacter michiganensis]|nr:hypothetical protein C5E11_14825 [Clavibacter michiganensis]